MLLRIKSGAQTMSKLLSVKDAAAIIGIGKDKMYKIIRENTDFPSIKFGEITKIYPSMLDEWLLKVISEDRKL